MSGRAILKIDMVGLSETELERIVAERCACYGRVASVRVVRAAGAAGFAFALVRMTTARSLERLLAHVGGAKSRSTAIISLEQESGSPPFKPSATPPQPTMAK